MFDTQITIIGNVLTAPEWRRTAQSGQLVANFKVASTARRLDRATNRWVDGNSLRVRVNCWRRLAEGVASSVMVGDPVIVMGRLYTRDWTDEDGQHRVMYEMEAVAVGHDLSRGQGTFARSRANLATSEVDDEAVAGRVNNEETEPVAMAPHGGVHAGAPTEPLFSEEEEATFTAFGAAIASLRGGGLTAELVGPVEDVGGAGTGPNPAGGTATGTGLPDGNAADGDGSGGDAQDADTDTDDVEDTEEESGSSGPRSRARRRRVPAAV